MLQLWGGTTLLGSLHRTPSVGLGGLLEALRFLPGSHLRMGWAGGVFLKRQYFKSEASKDMFNKDDADCKSLRKSIFILTRLHTVL